MIILHLADGTVRHLDTKNIVDVRYLDKLEHQRVVRRVAIVDLMGKRVDLPLNHDGVYRLWIERVMSDDEQMGERFCMKSESLLLKATLFYSDQRVVIDLDTFGGFRCIRRKTFH